MNKPLIGKEVFNWIQSQQFINLSTNNITTTKNPNFKLETTNGRAQSNLCEGRSSDINYISLTDNEDELNKEAEKIRKRKPGDTHIVTKKPQLDIYETQPASKYTDYINHIEKTIQLGIKFPSDILTGDFTSRASSQTTEDLTLKIARGFQRYIGNKLKIELINVDKEEVVYDQEIDGFKQFLNPYAGADNYENTVNQILKFDPKPYH